MILAAIRDFPVRLFGEFIRRRTWSLGSDEASEAIVCRLVAGFVLFFSGFFVLGMLGLFFAGRWVTILHSALVSVILTLLVFLWGRRRSPVAAVKAASAPNEKSALSVNRITRFVVATMAAGFTIITLLLLIGFPRGFEVHAYHMPIAINIFRTGSLRIWDHAFMHTYPANMSLWSGFWLQLLPERVVSIVNSPFLLLCFLFVYRLCRLTGADRSAAALVCCGLVTIPLFGFSAAELTADLGGVSFILAAIWLVLKRPRSFPTWPLLAGAASGLAYGFKPLHLVGAGLVGLWIAFAPRNERSPPGVRLVQAASYGLVFLALSGVWLVRNQLELGNPIYPVAVPHITELLGFTSAPDFQLQDRQLTEQVWVGASWQWLIYPWVEGQYINQNFKSGSGLGPFFAATLPMTWLAWGLMLARDRTRRYRSDAERSAFALYVFGTATFIIWWLLGDRQPRYVMAGIAELLPLSAVLLSSASGRVRRAYEITLGLGALFGLMVLIVQIGVEEGSLLSLRRLPTRAEVFEYPSRIDDLPPGAVILDLADRPWHYSLYGAHLANIVISNPEAIRLFRHGEAWNLDESNLRRLGVSYVFADDDLKLTFGCVGLRPEAQLERNPFNSSPLPRSRVLYWVEHRCPPDSP